MLDHFQGGPNLVRGFAPAGFGPRDLTAGTNQDALGGSYYWAATYEFQTPVFFAPKDFGMRLALFGDVGQLADYRGITYWSVTGESLLLPTDNPIRSSVGARHPVGFADRSAAVRFRSSHHKGVVRQDAVLPVWRRNEVLTPLPEVIVV